MASEWTPESLVASVRTIGSLPDIYSKLNDVMRKPSSSARDIGKVLAEDPVLTARLLRLVNSSFYSLSTKVETVSKAVVLVGTNELRDLVLATSVLSMFDDVPNDLMDMERFWRHSLACGLFAREMAKKLRLVNPELFFVSGLLHDVGRLVIFLKLGQLAGDAIVRSRDNNELLYRVENDVLGFSHAQVGAALIKAWNLPESHKRATEFHHGPWVPVYEIATVHVGDILANALQMGTSGSHIVPPLMPDAWKFLGLSEEVLPAMVRSVKRQYQDAISSILKKD